MSFIVQIASILIIGIIAAAAATGQLSVPIISSEPSEGNNYIIVTNVESSPKVSPAVPLRIEIPNIGVNATIESIGLAENGTVGVPKGPSTTAWFNLGPMPGATGSAVISGHFGPWRDGSHSVFDNLYKIKNGDKVYVRDKNGQTFAFSVVDVKIYDGDAIVPEIFNKTDGTYLNLITCSGEWLANQRTYDQRLVVFTKADK